MLARPTRGLFVAITMRSKLIQLRLTLTLRFFGSNSLAALFSKTCEPLPEIFATKDRRYFLG